MGLKFKDIIERKTVSMNDLNGKKLAVDSMNILYQFLTTIRGPEGNLFTNSKGKVTSHLIGLFNRTTTLMESGLKLAFVFDGKPPELKTVTKEKRKKIKEEASLLLKQAKEAGDVEGMKKYSSRTAILTKGMVEDAKKMISLLGLPVIQAPSEGEAQTAFMVKKGDVYASISQDYDNLIFGCPLLIRNLSIAGKRKKAGKFAYETVKPESIYLKENLEKLNLSLDQLVVLAILVGTDYNPAGIKGIGPKKGLKLLEKHGENFEAIFEETKWNESYDIDWKEIFDTIKHIPVTEDYNLEWKTIDKSELVEFLVEELEFSKERVESKINKMLSKKGENTQKGLSSFF